MYRISGAWIIQVFRSLLNFETMNICGQIQGESIELDLIKKSLCLIAVRHIYKLFELFWLLFYGSKIFVTRINHELICDF